jgi:tRNA dimethylallyltransferase
VNIDRDARREKITRRLKDRLEHGMVDEIKGLLERGIPAEDLIYYGLEYKYITEYIIGKLSYKEMFRQLEIAIHQFAKNPGNRTENLSLILCQNLCHIQTLFLLL